MKTVFLLSFFILSTNLFSAEVDGQMFYKLPDGNLVTRDVTIDVPARGQGEVVLSGKGFEWKTKKFWTKKIKGQTLFIAAFKTEFQEFKSTIILKGSYLKGSNQIKYYGDFYKMSGHGQFNENSLANFNYVGGFSFNYIR